MAHSGWSLYPTLPAPGFFLSGSRVPYNQVPTLLRCYSRMPLQFHCSLPSVFCARVPSQGRIKAHQFGLHSVLGYNSFADSLGFFLFFNDLEGLQVSLKLGCRAVSLSPTVSAFIAWHSVFARPVHAIALHSCVAQGVLSHPLEASLTQGMGS